MNLHVLVLRKQLTLKSHCVYCGLRSLAEVEQYSNKQVTGVRTAPDEATALQSSSYLQTNISLQNIAGTLQNIIPPVRLPPTARCQTNCF